MVRSGLKRKSRIITCLAAISVLIVVMAWCGVFPQAASAFADSPPDVRVGLETPGKVSPDSDFTVTVDISQVENFDAANYDVSFDATMLRLDNVTSGRIGSTTIPVDIWNQKSSGTYVIVQNVPGLPGVSGFGNLAVLHFHVVGFQGGTATISLSNGVLSNNLAEAIPATWSGDSLKVLSTEPAPATQPDSLYWPMLWGVIGGGVIAIGLLIFFKVRSRLY